MASLGDLYVTVGAKIEGFKSAMADVSTTVNKVNSEVGKAGAAMAAAFSVPLVGIGAAALKAGMDIDEATDTIRTGTGATGKALDGLKDSFSRVFANVPASAQVVGTAIADLNTTLGLTGKPLEQLSTQLVQLARLSKTEVGPLVTSTSRLFGDWSIATDKQSSTLDYLFKTSQATGLGINDLMEKVVQFGAPLRALGFSLEDAAALMGKWQKEGVNLETVLSGLRFALGKFAAAGKDPAKALAEVQTAIRGAKTESEATALAFEAFGKRAAVDMSRAIIEGRFQIDDLVKSIKGSSDTIIKAADETADFGEQWVIFKNKLSLALEPLGVQLMKSLGSLVDILTPVIDGVASIAKAFASLPQGVQTAVIALAAIAAAAGPTQVAFAGISRAVVGGIPQFKLLGETVARLGSLEMGLLAGSFAGTGGAYTAMLATGILRVAGWVALAAAIWQAVEAYQGMKQAESDLADARKTQQDKLLELEITMRRQGIDISEVSKAYHQGATSWTEYMQQLRNLEAAHLKLHPATKQTEEDQRKAAEAAANYSERLKEAQEILGVHIPNLRDQQSALRTIEQAYRSGATSLGVYLEALEKYGAIVDKLRKNPQPIPSTLPTQNASVLNPNAGNSGAIGLAEWAKKIRDLQISDPGRFMNMSAEPPDPNKITPLAIAIRDLGGAIVPADDALKLFLEDASGMDKAVLEGIKNLNLDSARKFFGIADPAELQRSAEVARAYYEVLRDSGTATAMELEAAYMDVAEAELEAAHAAGDTSDELYRQQKKNIEDSRKAISGNIRETRKEYLDLGRDLEGAFRGTVGQLERDLTKNLLTWKGWADTIKNLGTNLASDFLGTFLKGFFKPMEDQLAKLGKKIGDVLMDVFKLGGTGATTAAQTAGGAASSAGGAAGAAGSVGSSVGGIAGMINLASGVVSAVSGVIGNFQFAGMNKSLDVIVNHTLRIFNELTQFRTDAWTREDHLMKKLDDIWHTILGGATITATPTSALSTGATERDLLGKIRNAADLLVSKIDLFVLPKMDTMIGLMGQPQPVAVAPGAGGIYFDLRGSTFTGSTTEQSVRTMMTRAARDLRASGAINK